MTNYDMQMQVIVADQLSKVVSGVVVMASDISPQEILLQTGVLGVIVLAIAWGFKVNFLALGREVVREREESEKKDKMIADQRKVIAMFIQQGGHALPVMAEVSQQVVSTRDTELAQVMAVLEELKEAIQDGPSA